MFLPVTLLVLSVLASVVGVVNPVVSSFFIVSSSYFLYLTKPSKAEKVLNRMINKLFPEGKRPKVIKVFPTNYGLSVSFSVPADVSTDKFESKKLEIEQHLNTKVEFSFDDEKGFILMKIFTKKLEHNVPFEVVKTQLENIVYVGKSILKNLYVNLNEFPNWVIGATTGGGKSTFLKALITNIILTKGGKYVLYLFDFKKVELSVFRSSKHVRRYCDDVSDVDEILMDLIKEIDRRYEQFKAVGLTNFASYNALHKPKMKRILCVFDEFKDITDKETKALLDLAMRKCRAAGVHFWLATQLPTADVISSGIKANCDCAVAFRTSFSLYSRIILDQNGAEKLKGNGHGLISLGGNITEFQSPYIDDDPPKCEITELIKHTFVEKKEAEKPKKANIEANVDDAFLRRFLNGATGA